MSGSKAKSYSLNGVALGAASISARTTERSACTALEAGLTEDTHSREMKSDALAQRSGTYTWTTANWAVKNPSNLSYHIRLTN